jgi:hypothetical protein
MSLISVQKLMLAEVAIALGDELLKDVVFVGGCSTGLLVTDEFTKEQIRYTDDVDLIVDVVGYPAWIVLQEQLGRHGFTIDMGEEAICRMLLGELKVDFMPIDSGVLGFTNRWYKDALAYAQDFVLNEQITIKLISPEYFVATKLEAYLGRGKGDALASHDIEDLLNIFDGRQAINAKVKNSSTELQHYISTQLSALLEDENFEYAIQSLTNGDAARENLILKEFRALHNMGDAHLKIECCSLKGKKRSANQDLIATFSLAEGVLIVLVDIATATSVDDNSFISTLNRKISQHITRAHFKETTLIPCFVKIVDELKRDFKTGCASLIVTYIPFRKSNVWGFVVGDARLGKLDQQKIEWITPVHTAANPFGEKFTEKMKDVPESIY